MDKKEIQAWQQAVQDKRKELFPPKPPTKGPKIPGGAVRKTPKLQDLIDITGTGPS